MIPAQDGSNVVQLRPPAPEPEVNRSEVQTILIAVLLSSMSQKRLLKARRFLEVASQSSDAKHRAVAKRALSIIGASADLSDPAAIAAE